MNAPQIGLVVLVAWAALTSMVWSVDDTDWSWWKWGYVWPLTVLVLLGTAGVVVGTFVGIFQLLGTLG